MNRIVAVSTTVVGMALAAVPAVAGLRGNPSFSHQLPVRVPSRAQVVTLVGDDHPETASTSPSRTRPSRTSPTRTSPSRPTPAAVPTDGATSHREPGDDHRGATSHREPGDDHGGATTHHPEPGDDHGGATTTTAPAPGDDKDGPGGHDDHGQDGRRHG